MMGTAPVVAAVVLTWNGKEHVLRCLRSIEGLDYPKKSLQILVVDNGSVDGSQAAIRAMLNERHEYLKTEIIELPENVGAPAAFNRALQNIHPDARFVWKLDNDVTLEKNYLRLLVDACHSDTLLGAVGGRILDPQGIDQPVGAVLFPPPKRWLAMLDYRTAAHLEHQPIAVILGASCLFSREVFSEYGLFDERFFLYYDDSEYTLRLKLRGREMIVVSAAVATHHISSSVGRLSGKQLAYMTRNHVLFGLAVFKGPEKVIFVIMQFVSLPWRIFRMNRLFSNVGPIRAARYVVSGFAKALLGRYGELKSL